MALAFIPTSAVQPLPGLDVPRFPLEVEQVQPDAAEVGERLLCLRAELGYKIRYSLMVVADESSKAF